MSLKKPLKKIGVLISGGGSNLQALIDTVHQVDGEIVVVISSKAHAYGLKRAQAANIETLFLDPSDYANNASYNQALIGYLKDYQVDLVVLAGYLKIITDDFVKTFPNAIINIHPALIPSFCGKGYYGMHVHEKVRASGVKLTGATVHFVNEIADDGPIIAQAAITVADDDTPESIQKKVLVLEHQLLPQAVADFCRDAFVVEGRRVKKIAYDEQERVGRKT